ncbi:MAG: methylmalonyl Co-A mutase-associated GTPase MeaB [Thermoanaerobaculia bacterium]
MQASSGNLTIEDHVRGIRESDRGVLARAITLVESRKPEDMALAQELLARLLAHTGDAVRVGITGIPGVGKSTFVDALGTQLIDDGHRVAVLAVDPSSSVSGGSILGDKSRMPSLAAAEEAFIRPSPSALSLGGVTRRTRETMLLCEAAGFDVILVETVGVGQSETMVADMVDFFLVLVLAGAGDELQGIKKGIIELADLVAVNKADGDNLERAQLAQRDYAAARRYLGARSTSWEPQVVTVSALTGAGMAELWELVEEHHSLLVSSGELEERRRHQLGRWMWSLIEEKLLDSFRQHPEVTERLAELERAVAAGTVTPTQAATELLTAFQPPR